MGIMAGEAIPNCGLVDMTLDLGGVLVSVAGEAKLDGGGGNQLHPRRILIYPNLMAAEASGRHGRVHRLSLGLVFVAGQASGGVGILLQRNRVNLGEGRGRGDGQDEANQRKPGDNQEQVSAPWIVGDDF